MSDPKRQLKQRRWKPPIPLAQASPEVLREARILRDTIKLALSREHSSLLNEKEFWSGLCQDYQRLSGESISETRIREIFKRTKERDRGIQEFDRLQLYLPDRVQPFTSTAPAPAEAEPECFNALRDLIAAFGPAPDVGQKEQIWDEACCVHKEAIETGYDPRTARGQLLSLLQASAACLVRVDCSDVAEALRVNFHRKYERWTRDGQTLEAVADGRRLRKRKQPVEFSADEFDYLRMLTARYNNTDLALREFLLSDKARPETKAYFQWNPSLRRLRTPAWLREILDPVRDQQQKFIRGHRASRLQGAFTDRDPATLASGDSDQSDDKTLDLYWWDDTPEGVWFGQGQLLVWEDERSWLIQSFRLIPDGAYSGFSIRNSWTDKTRKWGLPRKRIHVENGSWRSSKVFKGVAPSSNGWENVGLEETEEGLRRLGIRFRHATMPRGKLIERLFGSLTDLTMMLPGYAGRCQMIDRFEEVQRKVRLVKSGQEHPGELGFLHKSQVVEHLNDLAHKMNNTVKYGEYHQKRAGGRTIYLSPQEAYEEFFTTPLVFIPPQLEHLYRDNKIIKTVGPNGIQLHYGKRSYRYKRSAELGRLEGCKVTVWFNPEDPSAISVMHPNNIESFAVPLEERSSHEATPEELADAARSSNVFQSYQREISRTLKPVFREEMQSRLFRYPVVDSTAVDSSQQIEAGRVEIRSKARATATRASAVRKAADRVGIIPSPEALGSSESARELSELAEFLEGGGTAAKGEEET